MQRAAWEFPCKSEKLWVQIVNGTLWVDHSLAPWPPDGWYPAELGGGAPYTLVTLAVYCTHCPALTFRILQ